MRSREKVQRHDNADFQADTNNRIPTKDERFMRSTGRIAAFVGLLEQHRVPATELYGAEAKVYGPVLVESMIRYASTVREQINHADWQYTYLGRGWKIRDYANIDGRDEPGLFITDEHAAFEFHAVPEGRPSRIDTYNLLPVPGSLLVAQHAIRQLTDHDAPFAADTTTHGVWGKDLLDDAAMRLAPRNHARSA